MHIIRFVRFFLVIFALLTLIIVAFWLAESSVTLEKEQEKTQEDTKDLKQEEETNIDRNREEEEGEEEGEGEGDREIGEEKRKKNKENVFEYWFPFPKNTHLRLVCDDKNPKTVQVWRKTLGVDFTFNAGYFDENNMPVGYVKTENKTWGNVENYPAFLGFTNTNNENILEISVAQSDKNIENTFEFTLESFPLLVENSIALFPRETHKYANRTIVGQKNGEWGVQFFLLKPSLFQSSQILVEKGFSTAINLDGGPSTGFSSKEKEIFSIKVPCVLAGRY